MAVDTKSKCNCGGTISITDPYQEDEFLTLFRCGDCGDAYMMTWVGYERICNACGTPLALHGPVCMALIGVRSRSLVIVTTSTAGPSMVAEPMLVQS